MTQGRVSGLWRRITGRAQLERLAAVEATVGKFGRAQREDLAAQHAQVSRIGKELSGKADERAVRRLERRLDDIQASLVQQDREYGAALERAGRLDEQAVDARRFARRIEQMLRHDRPIVVGPWTGEVGFELLYWVPFVRWVVATYGLPAERLVIVSRGGVRSWYEGLGSRYEEMFAHVSTDDYRQATERAKKQRLVGAFDADVVERVSRALHLERPALLHPGMMYRLFMPFWKDIATAARVESFTHQARLAAPRDPVEDQLPKDYVAARFYFSDCFPDTAENRALVASALEAVTRHLPVVVLSTPFAVDDHRDAPHSNSQVLRVDEHLTPERNLAVQSAVIARARAFVGTYGGYSYLAPYLGVPSVALFSHRTFKAQHLHLADSVFTRLGGATLTPLDAAALPGVTLMLEGLTSAPARTRGQSNTALERRAFLMDSPEYLRFYDTAIDELASRGHDVTLAVMNGRERKPVGLEGLQAHAGRVRVAGVVPANTGPWANIATRLRATMDFVRFLHPTLAAAPALRARIKRKVLPRAYHGLDAIPSLSPRTVRGLLRVLAGLERAIPPYRPILDLLRAESPDVLLVSPLVAAASEQVDWVKAGRACGLRTAVGVASWDNLTNKGLLRIQPDAVLVWNEAQRREAVEYHDTPAANVSVTGAQLFDRWFDRRVSRDRAAFCRHAGLPDDRPFVLFTGSSVFISRSDAEVAFVRRWLQALRASADPLVRDVNVLVRPHPYNCHAWETDPLADLPGVAVYPGRGYSPITAEARADFFDSLSHAAVVVGINTSAMIEAAIVGKPVCSILAPEFAGTQEGTIHFRHLLPEHGGFLRIAATLDEHVAQLADRLANPAGSRDETQRFVASFIRPCGVERPATPVFVDALEALAAKPAPAPRSLPLWAPAGWVVLGLATIPAVAVDWLAAHLPRIRKQGSWVAHKGRKQVRGIGVRVATRVRKAIRVVVRFVQRSAHRWQRARAR